MKVFKEVISLFGMSIFTHLEKDGAEVLSKSQDALEKVGGERICIIEPAVVADDLRDFGTEFKIPAGCFGGPFANGFRSVHLVMGGV